MTADGRFQGNHSNGCGQRASFQRRRNNSASEDPEHKKSSAKSVDEKMLVGPPQKQKPPGRRPLRGEKSSATTAGTNHHRPRSRNHTLSMPAVHIKTHDMLNPWERRFLEAAERGDRPTLISCLNQKNVALNINAVDAMGRTAIEIAVDNENMEIVELLLQQEGIRIGNALLCAIREGVYLLAEILVNHPSITKDMLCEGWSKSLDPVETAISEYSSDISPVILAAHLNRFEILQMLLRKDATIEKPHKHNCNCETCDKERLNDSLHYSLKRINTYRALASPAWMSLTSSDPILCAFRLSWELQKLSVLEDEFKDTYVQLSEQCKQFACDLLSQCRSTEEVIAILNKEDNMHDENIDVWASKLSLSRLKKAIKYDQKMFVSHPHCQQLLTSIWYEGFPVRQQRGSYWNFAICALLILLWPILSICYIMMPKTRIGRIVRSPFMKFLYFSISFGCFLALLTMVTFESYREETGEIKGGGQNRASDRGPPPTVIEWLVLTWVLGMLWSEVKQLWEEGLYKYVYQWWNWLDFIMICLYLCTISLRTSAYYIYVYDNNGYTPRYTLQGRTHWDAYEPILVSEALFAVGNVFSFARIIYLFQTNPYLGPLQISLGCMLVDVAKFCFIFILIISSFSIGLAQLYWYYDSHTPVCISPDECKLVPNAFSSIANSYMTLLWSLFSITKVEDTDVAEDHYFTQWFTSSIQYNYNTQSNILLSVCYLQYYKVVLWTRLSIHEG
ncbi:transient receptor ion channel II domain-containing protein [Ditylenchus destructor]|nr:transient receptor ion channel II domain-containing protein [Ditylenchus destructor]